MLVEEGLALEKAGNLREACKKYREARDAELEGIKNERQMLSRDIQSGLRENINKAIEITDKRILLLNQRIALLENKLKQ
jgi:predicted  nucleic acid-binding Zn-ribbon protein